MQDEKGGVPGTSVLLDYNVDFCWTRLVISRVSDSRILSTIRQNHRTKDISLVKVSGCVENESLVQILGNVIQARGLQFIYFLAFC